MSPSRAGACERVYFIRAGIGGPIKIGLSDDPTWRLASLQVGNHEPLTLLGHVAGSRDIERSWHERFAALRIRGEWFGPHSSLLGAIAEEAWTSHGRDWASLVHRAVLRMEEARRDARLVRSPDAASIAFVADGNLAELMGRPVDSCGRWYERSAMWFRGVGA